MDYFQTFAISRAGMDVERARVEAAAMNLANANTVLRPGQPGYTPMRVVAQASRLAAAGPFDHVYESQSLSGPVAVHEQAAQATRRAYEPQHPAADAEGFVTYPNVDTTQEMLGLMSAIRAYEANVAAMNAAKTLCLKALDIGGAA